jgi:hypothetical protein
MPSPQGDGIHALELVAEETGGVRLAGLAPGSVVQGRPVPVSGGIPVYLAASPPAVKGEPRFELTFTINDRRCLCVTVRDLATNRLLKTNEESHMLVWITGEETMEMQELEIIIDNEGRIQVKVTGAHGAGCLEITKNLEQAAGDVENREFLPAYYEQPVSAQEHQRLTLR